MSRDFDLDFTAAERDAAIANRATVRGKAAGVAATTAQMDALFALVLANTQMAIDDPQLTAEDRQYSRALNANGVPNAPEYRHEFLMTTDGDYRAAWSSEHYVPSDDPEAAPYPPADPAAVARGLVAHPYREADPEIVDRSLLRWGYRLKREGEEDPPPVYGKHAPTAPTANFSSSASGLVASFTDTSTVVSSPITAWAWDFGDGSTSAVQNPSRTYAAAGSYTISLTVTTSGGTSTISKTLAVTATAVSNKALGWGRNTEGQVTIPTRALSGVTAIAGGGYHSLGIKQDGAAIAWGRSIEGQRTIPETAASGVQAVAGGAYFSLALKTDGSVVGWGQNTDGQITIPTGAQSGVTAIAAGNVHSLALKSNGSVIGWGSNGYGQRTIPAAAQSGVTAIAAGNYHSLALKSDGSVIGWGASGGGQITIPTAAQSGVTAIAAGINHSLALKSDGSVIGWGQNTYGQITIPTGAQSGVTAIAAGNDHSLALKSDGSVISWGSNDYGQRTIPAAAQSGVTAIAAGSYHSLAMKPV